MRYERGIRAVDIAPIIRGLVEARMAWGFTTKDIAQRIGCKSRTLASMESGSKLPSFKVLVKWADVLGFELGLKSKAVIHRVTDNTKESAEAA